METVFLNDCAADNCYNRNSGNGSQLCKKHQLLYDAGEKVKAFYGKTIQKKEFQTIKKTN